MANAHLYAVIMQGQGQTGGNTYADSWVVYCSNTQESNLQLGLSKQSNGR